MSKNMTRKGLAVGSAVALAFAGLTSAPAFAAGADGTAQLVPTTGYAEGWAVPATATATFSATYTTTDSSGGTIKFLVEDPTGRIEPTAASSARTGYTTHANDTAAVSSNVVTVTTANSSTAGLAVGDLVEIAAADFATVVTAGTYEITAVTATTWSFKFTANDAANIAMADVVAIEVLREARAADNSFVIDTGVTTNNAQTATLVLSSKDGASVSRSAAVKGWVDRAALLNDRIDAIESTTDSETIRFVKVSEITATTSLQAPVAGDTTLTAYVSTTPVLNGAQTNADNATSALGQNAAADFIRVLFSRQDSTVRGVSDSASQSTVDGLWTATVGLDTNEAMAAHNATSKKIAAQTGWGFTAPTDRAANAIGKVEVSAAKVATVTTDAAHNLRTGDKVTVSDTDGANDSNDIAAMAETAAAVTVVSSTVFTYRLTETGTVTAASVADAADTKYVIATYSANPKYLVGRVFAGTYSAQTLINTADVANDADEEYTPTGSASSIGTLAAAANDVSLATAGSATVQGAVTIADDDTRDAYVKAGTTTVTVTGTVLDEDGEALGAGRAVTFTVARSSATSKVNDKTTSGIATTDASGQVKFTVTDTLGLSGTTVTINVTAENAASSDFTLEWATQSYSLYDLNVSDSSALGASATRLVAEGSSYTLNLLFADQWVQAPAEGDYRLAVSGSGVTEGFVNIVGGKASVAIKDPAVASTFTSTLTVQKKGTTGVFADTTTTSTITTNTTTKAKITLGADASALYDNPVVTVDLADLVAKKALVERDTRTSFVAQPAYVNDVVIAGKVTNSSTGANLGNAVVTVSGPTNILFSDGAVDKRGSITIVSDANGEFSVKLYSTSAQTDTVITVNAAGATAATTKVTFTGIGVGEGTALTVDAPANVKPASTFQVKAKLADVYGNGVEATAGRIKVTYTGPGIVFGTLPDKTDKNGELMFSVLLGSNDTGNVVVTVSYDQNGDADYVDAKDLNTTKTITVGTGAAAGAGKVNVGSFNGKLVVYASGLNGATISWKVGGKWGKGVASSNYAVFNRPTPVAGATVSVDIYVNGVKTLTKSVVTR